jgi:dolichyl-diphosphooligosaccharide--protein glycosyltransferase
MNSKAVDKHWHWIFLVVAIIISLYLRIINPWDSVFTWTVRLGGNDPWYYYRLVENSIANYPNRIWFDAFTNYPYGSYLHFGPFLVFLGATLSKIVGATDPESIKTVLAFIPAIGGTLLIFPVYLFTKEVFNRKAGVIASLLVVMVPGQLMLRSILGFNDHHVWETFWMVSYFALFVHSLSKWHGRKGRENVRDLKHLMYPVFTGIALGMYLDTWAPGFIAGVMMVGAIFIIFLVKELLDADTDNLAYIGFISYLVAAVVYAPFSNKYPFFHTTKYSLFQLIILGGLAFIVLVFYAIQILQNRGYFSKIGVNEKYVFPLVTLISGGLIIAVFAVFFPELFTTMSRILRVVSPKGGALTIAEVQPFFVPGGRFSLAPAWSNFSMTFFFGMPALVYVLYKLYKERRTTYIIALVWSFALLIALAGQNRFAYYFAVISAILAGVALDALLHKLKFYDAVKGIFEGLRGGSWSTFKKSGYGKFVVGVLIILLLFYPTVTGGITYSKYGVGGPKFQWWEALTWMRDNTPDPNLDYYAMYTPRELGKPYSYPDGAYGVMSWWDYGHWITAIAHRIPNANPFQQGIGGPQQGNKPGAAPFFTAQSEEEADRIADALGVRYVISDVEMATGKFYAIATWAEGDASSYYTSVFTRQGRVTVPGSKYFNSMEAKLHILDGNGLKHYRMVYESHPATGYYGNAELMYKQVYQAFYKTPLSDKPTGYVKIFEYVKGAVITGKVPGDVKSVTLTVTIKTNQDREITYRQQVEVINGVYTFIVPYSQDTSYPVKPTGPYSITAGDITKTVNVTEEDVIGGNIITLDFF